MKIRLDDAAKLTGGKIIGNSDITITGIAKIHEAVEGDLTFLYMETYVKHLKDTSASVVLIKPEFERTRDDIAYLVVDRPDYALQQIIMKWVVKEPNLKNIDSTAFVPESSSLGENVSLGRNVVVGENVKIGNNTKIFHNTVILDNVTIGDNTLVYPNVTIREDCVIGNNNIIHPGVVIGSDGFGYNPNEKGEFIKVPQIGNVILEDSVEIGANCSIDRAAIGSTIIRQGSKLDNLVQIAHNVEIGKHTAISSQSGVAGSTKIGDHCILAGQVGVVGHIEVADNVIIAAQTGVSKTIKKSGTYFGYPAKEISQSRKLEAHFRNLPKYAEKLSELGKKVTELEKKS